MASSTSASPVITPLASIQGVDFRAVPVAGIDSHLPAIASAALTPQALRQRFAAPPAWQPEVTLEKKYLQREPTHASVLVPILLRDTPTVVLTQRTAHLSTHSGQVAFPGGRRDPEDADAAATALREAHEEVGLDPHQAEVLGCLPLYVTGSAYLITPVVALVQPQVQWRPNPYEVDAVFEVPLSFLLNPAHHRRHVFERDGIRREWFSMPYQDGAQERFIWGATAGMLRNFYRFMAA